MLKIYGDKIKNAPLSEERKLERGVKWFWNVLKGLADKTKNKIKRKTKQDDGLIDLDDMGKMRPFHLYTMIYDDPLWKDKLIVWDSLPLFFPIDVVNGKNGPRIRGINIHYLPPGDRVRFMLEIEKMIKKEAAKKKFKDLDEFLNSNDLVTRAVGTFMNSVYQQTQNSAGNKIKVCYRSYLLNRIGSKIQKVSMNKWNEATYSILPSFNKMGPVSVYEMINDKYDKYRSSAWKNIY